MTKRNQIPPGMDCKCPRCDELFKCCDCLPTSRAQAGVQKVARTRPLKEPEHPDYNVPAASVMANANTEKHRDTFAWFALGILMFCVGSFVTMVALSQNQ